MPVQVNGKVRARMEVEVDAGQEEVESLALEQPNVQAHVQDNNPKKIIVIPNRLGQYCGLTVTGNVTKKKRQVKTCLFFILMLFSKYAINLKQNNEKFRLPNR